MHAPRAYQRLLRLLAGASLLLASGAVGACSDTAAHGANSPSPANPPNGVSSINSAHTLIASAPSTAPGPATATPPATLARVRSGVALATRTLPGELRAFQQVDLAAKLPAFVRAVLVDRGDRVHQGQVLVRLDAPELALNRGAVTARVRSRRAAELETRASLATLRAGISAARASHQEASLSQARLRQAQQASAGAVSQQALDVAEQRLQRARAQVQGAEAELAAREKAVDARASDALAEGAQARPLGALEQYLVLRAPFAGVITERNVHAGAFVSPAGRGTPLLRLQQLDRLRLVVAVPEREVAAVEKGATLYFRVAAYPGKPFRGVVARAARALDPGTRTMPLELDVENAGELMPGMYAEVEWKPRAARAALFVPTTAVVSTAEREFVIRVRHGRGERVDVRRGSRAGELVEVAGALRDGETVLARASDEIPDGAPVAAQ